MIPQKITCGQNGGKDGGTHGALRPVKPKRRKKRRLVVGGAIALSVLVAPIARSEEIFTPQTGPIRTALTNYQPPDVGGPQRTTGSGTR
jgi:hypothetical protein